MHTHAWKRMKIYHFHRGGAKRGGRGGYIVDNEVVRKIILYSFDIHCCAMRKIQTH